MLRTIAIALACAVLGGCVSVKTACQYRPVAAVGVGLLGAQLDIGPEARLARQAGTAAADVLCGEALAPRVRRTTKRRN